METEIIIGYIFGAICIAGMIYIAWLGIYRDGG